MFAAWEDNPGVRGDASWFLEAFAVLLLSLTLVGFAQRLRQYRPDTFYVSFYVALILVWPIRIT